MFQWQVTLLLVLNKGNNPSAGSTPPVFRGARDRIGSRLVRLQASVCSAELQRQLVPRCHRAGVVRGQHGPASPVSVPSTPPFRCLVGVSCHSRAGGVARLFQGFIFFS